MNTKSVCYVYERPRMFNVNTPAGPVCVVGEPGSRIYIAPAEKKKYPYGLGLPLEIAGELLEIFYEDFEAFGYRKKIKNWSKERAREAADKHLARRERRRQEILRKRAQYDRELAVRARAAQARYLERVEWPKLEKWLEEMFEKAAK